MDTFDYLFVKARENGKVAKALSDKLQTEVDKNKLVEAIQGIDVEAIIKALFINKMSGLGLNFENLNISGTSIADVAYRDKIFMTDVTAPNVTTIGDCGFQDCISLVNVDISSAITVKNYAFYNCIEIKSLNFPFATSLGRLSLCNCISLQNIKIPLVEAISASCFYNDISLTQLDLSSVTTINTLSFKNCLSLKTVKLGASQIVTLDNVSAFANTPMDNGTGYIYVPDELVSNYKTATNWSVYASQIKPMSEYVEETE